MVAGFIPGDDELREPSIKSVLDHLNDQMEYQFAMDKLIADVMPVVREMQDRSVIIYSRDGGTPVRKPLEELVHRYDELRQTEPFAVHSTEFIRDAREFDVELALAKIVSDLRKSGRETAFIFDGTELYNQRFMELKEYQRHDQDEDSLRKRIRSSQLPSDLLRRIPSPLQWLFNQSFWEKCNARGINHTLDPVLDASDGDNHVTIYSGHTDRDLVHFVRKDRDDVKILDVLPRPTSQIYPIKVYVIQAFKIEH